MKKRNTSCTQPYTAIAFAALLLSATIAAADIQYWNPTTTAKGAGNGIWEDGVGAWADTTAGTTTPVAWADGNNAYFTLNGGVNEVTVNGASAGLLYFTAGTYRFLQGDAPLALAGPVTNTGTTLTFNNDIALTADQEWYVAKQITANGALSGPYTLKKTGTQPLVISNANNSVGGIFLDTYYIRAYGGGNTLGGPDSTFTIGSPDQMTVAKLELYPMTDRSDTVWNAGALVANGFGEVASVATSATVTNTVAFGALQRTNCGVLSIRQSADKFENRQRFTFSNSDDVVKNGMLPPWVATQASANFLGYDDFIKDVTYKTSAPDTWTDTDIVHNTAARTLDEDAAVYALRMSANDITIPEGVTLTNASGGLVLVGRAIRGGGTLDCDGNELIVYATGTSAIYPRINADGLTVWGGGTLNVSNITWQGDTYLQQGSLRVYFDEDETIGPGNNIRGALGNMGNPNQFIKAGSGNLHFVNADSQFGKLLWEDGDTITFTDSVVKTLGNTGTTGGLVIPKDGASLLFTNSIFTVAGSALATASGIKNATIDVVKSTIDCGNFGIVVGSANGSNNTMMIDGGGVTGGAVITGISNSGNVGFAVGKGAHSCSNVVMMINGAEVWDKEEDTNRDNGIGVGDGAVGNRIEVIGGHNYVTTFAKSFPDSIGEGTGATENVMLVDGKGFPGSAQFTLRAEKTLTVGSFGGHNNSLIVRDGGVVSYGSLTVGNAANNNTVMLTGTGTDWTSGGGGDTFEIGVPIKGRNNEQACSNFVYVADGARMSNFGKWQSVIGGRGSGGSSAENVGTSFDNRVVIGSNGYWRIPNDLHIGRVGGTNDTSIAYDNALIVSGKNAEVSAGAIYVGSEFAGSRAYNNKLIVENDGSLTCSYIMGGYKSGDTAGGMSSGNKAIVRDGGYIRVTQQVRGGGNSNARHPENNIIEATTGGILDANTLFIYSPSNNVIRFVDGGVWQMRTRTPAVTSLTPGDIAIHNGVISYVDMTTVVVRDNWTQQPNKLAWSGNNAFRLANSATGTANAQSYLFDPNISPTNYYRLEMVNGTTVYRTQSSDTGALTIGESVGSGGEMLCSNTTAAVSLPFVMNGTLTLFNSTLTLEKDAEINGDVIIDLDHLVDGDVTLAALQNLTLGETSRLRFVGDTPQGRDTFPFMTCSGILAGDFATVEGLHYDYSVVYRNGDICIKHTPRETVIIVR